MPVSFESVQEALEYYVKKYPNIPKILIESAIEYDQCEQRKITEHLKILADNANDGDNRVNKIKERLKKKLLDKPKMVIETDISKVVEFK